MRSPDTYAQLYRLHILENDFDAATCVLEESLEYFPDNVDSLNSLGDLYARKARIGSIEKDILPSSNTDFIRKSIDFFIRSLLISPLGTNVGRTPFILRANLTISFCRLILVSLPFCITRKITIML